MGVIHFEKNEWSGPTIDRDFFAGFCTLGRLIKYSGELANSMSPYIKLKPLTMILTDTKGKGPELLKKIYFKRIYEDTQSRSGDACIEAGKIAILKYLSGQIALCRSDEREFLKWLEARCDAILPFFQDTADLIRDCWAKLRRVVSLT